MQPLDQIKDYFGIKIALYFAWLGHYTDMLIPVSLFGMVSLIFGWISLDTNSLTQDICDPEMNIIMCPLCDKMCGYWNLTEACLYSQITTTFDNYLTLFFAITMSVWSSLYLSLWKSSSAKIIHRWGLSGILTEKFTPRPEYLTKLNNLTLLNKKTKQPKETKDKPDADITDPPQNNTVNQSDPRDTEKDAGYPEIEWTYKEAKVPWRIKTPIVVFSAACALFWVSIRLNI